MDNTLFLTNWIWTQDWTAEDVTIPRIVQFRKCFELDCIPVKKTIQISADCRYKLYVNGFFVQEGPQKAADTTEWFVDQAELASWLKHGENVIAAEVLHYPVASILSDSPNSNQSIIHTGIPNLYIADDDETNPNLSGKTGWKACVNREVCIFGEDTNPAPLHIQENVDASACFAGWKEPGYDDRMWRDALPYSFFDIPTAEAPGNLKPRTIPLMVYEDKRFTEVTAVREGTVSKNTWMELLENDTPVTIPANTVYTVEISAGAEECGYLIYSFSGGEGAKVSTLCSECYAYPQPAVPGPFGPQQQLPLKGDRTDAVNGKLLGHTSFYSVAGYGTESRPECYEPFWFRTFRYIQLRIVTADTPLQLCGFRYRATGYPLEEKTVFTSSDPDFPSIWDISVRTLRRCMHETYMDCPFYEQLQYAMDCRSEILYTYAISADDRLARQAMEAFRRSQRPDGLVSPDAPSIKGSLIPGFSLYYLLMVYDHMMYFGDRQFVKLHLPAIDQILAYFDRNLNTQGLVGKIGGKLMRHKYWSFVDWTTKWDTGVPGATDMGTGAITMESLLYLYGLQHGAELADFCGRTGLAKEYQMRAETLRSAVSANCFGKYGDTLLIQDGPGIHEYSVHSQVFAILTGIVTPEEGKAMLKATVGNQNLPQASVSFVFYLFRALEVCDWYEKTDELWELWRTMLRNHMTTCVENDTDARSDCHAWASLICYEMPAVILGVRPAAPGFSKVHIAPKMGMLTEAAGDVITPHGLVHVNWKKEDDSCQISYELPAGMQDLT